MFEVGVGAFAVLEREEVETVDFDIEIGVVGDAGTEVEEIPRASWGLTLDSFPGFCYVSHNV